jgi:hypothetical protein
MRMRITAPAVFALGAMLFLTGSPGGVGAQSADPTATPATGQAPTAPSQDAISSEAPGQTAGADAATARPLLVRVPWKRLKFSASKFFLSASTAISAAYLPSAEVAGDILAPPQGTARPLPEPTVAVVTSDTDLPFGRHELATVWLDPSTGAVAQGHKITQGRDPYEKYFRYTTEGFFLWRNSPQSDSERKQPPERWGKRRQRFVATAQPLPAGASVTDSYALFYLASAARLDRKGARLTTYLLQDEKLVELTFTAMEQRQIRCDVRVSSQGGEKTRSSVVVRRVTLSGHVVGQPPSGKGDDVDLGLMDMRGSLTMLVEVGTGIPFEISGRTGSIGELTVGLDRIYLD